MLNFLYLTFFTILESTRQSAEHLCRHRGTCIVYTQQKILFGLEHILREFIFIFIGCTYKKGSGEKYHKNIPVSNGFLKVTI
jgi:hypothetical protein